jgi:hypothetical protein
LSTVSARYSSSRRIQDRLDYPVPIGISTEIEGLHR